MVKKRPDTTLFPLWLPKKERYPGTGGCSFSCSSPVTMSREDQTAYRKMFLGMISWFVIDTAGSFAAHLPGNVILNMVFLTAMRQPEISMAMKYLMDQEWIRSRESSGESKGRPIKIYELAQPFNEIMDYIENEKKNKENNKLALVQKLRQHLR